MQATNETNDSRPFIPEAIASHVEWFEKYADAKIAKSRRDPTPLTLKLRHTRNVIARAARIVASENFAGETARAVLLGALYHDLGRFDQYLDYGTFKDAESRNHGLLSLKILKSEARLAEESAAVAKITQMAVAWHNRYELPITLKGVARRVCAAVRDADKLDIAAIMAAHLSRPKPYNPTMILSLPDRDDVCSEKTVSAARAGRLASYKDLVTVNDFRVLVASWYFDMNFAASRDMFVREGAARVLAEGLPPNELYGETREFLIKLLATN